ncbi:MAG: hypothetical protein Q9213_001629 [Squamulea squamosa]
MDTTVPPAPTPQDIEEFMERLPKVKDKTLLPFYDATRQELERCRGRLENPKFTAMEVAFSRLLFNLMHRDLVTKAGWLRKLSNQGMIAGKNPFERWLEHCQTLAGSMMVQQLTPSEDLQRRKGLEKYESMAWKLLTDDKYASQMMIDKATGKSMMSYPPNRWERLVRDLAVSGWTLSSKERLFDQKFAQDLRSDFIDFLVRQPEEKIILRASQLKDFDERLLKAPTDPNLAQMIIEMVIGFIPIIGNLVALHEIVQGEDLFGNSIEPEERVIMAAFLLLPMIGRVAKFGKPVYSEARLASLLGDKMHLDRVQLNITVAGGKSKVLAEILEFATNASHYPTELGQIERAGSQILMRRFKRGSVVLREAVTAVSTLFRPWSKPKPLNDVLEKFLTELTEEIGRKFPNVATLDAFAIKRLVWKASVETHCRGQLLEELIESEIVPLLSKRGGDLFMGVSDLGGKLEYIPGHLIVSTAANKLETPLTERTQTDSRGAALTDGILAVRKGGKLHIMAVFEAKAGTKANQRNLSLLERAPPRGSLDDPLSEISQYERYLDDVEEALMFQAAKEGKKYVANRKALRKTISHREKGGQGKAATQNFLSTECKTLLTMRPIRMLVGLDIERLSKEDRLWVGGQEIRIEFSRQKTKFFGVVASPGDTEIIKEELKEFKVLFEILHVKPSEEQLKSITAWIQGRVKDNKYLIFSKKKE